MVTVLVSTDMVELALAKSQLESEGIGFVTTGEGVQDLFGLGRAGGYNFVTGPIQLRVSEDDASRATELLQELREV